MKSIFVISFILLICLCSCYARDLLVGTVNNDRLIWQQNVEYMGIPFKKRVKDFFYSDLNMQIIKGIVARDLEQSEASATITAGGIGFTFVNIRLKSARGSGLNYRIELYA